MTNSITQILHLARSGMLARFMDLDVVANNLANVNSIGYKRTRANFQELLTAGGKSGVGIRATQRLMDQGSLRPSRNPLDLAIQGEGFFAVRLEDGGTAYTRDGQFRLDADGQIVTADGYRLVWTGSVPADALEIHVNPDGGVMVRQGDTWSQVGEIQLTRFANPSGLQGQGQNLWLETEISGSPQSGAPASAGLGLIVGNALEASNVNLAQEMTHMISLQRAFEMSLRTFEFTDQMLSQAIRMRRG